MKRLTWKSILLISILSVCFIIVSAQNKILQIYKGGIVVHSVVVSDIDSLKFVDIGDVDNPNYEQGVVINGVRWSTRNIDEPGKFVASPENVGKYYQWNRKKSWASSGNVNNWDTSMPTGSIWTADNSPCPDGWRLPTKEEMRSLIDAGCIWTTVNGVSGLKFGKDENSIFIPAGGNRNKDKGELGCEGYYAQYWTSTRYDAGNIYTLFGTSGGGNMLSFPPNYGMPIRCVADESQIINVTSIKLNTEHIDLKIGATYKLTAIVFPSNATYPEVTWKSISPNIISVDENGLLTALAEGESYIFAYAGNKHTICTVNVYSESSYDEGVIINGIKWATRNVGEPGKFAESPEAPGMLYQWNHNIGWSTTDKNVSIPEGAVWDYVEVGEEANLENDAYWEAESNPCPDGWRLPTRTELESLISSGYKGETRNGVTGIVVGSGNNTIFLPMAGEKSRFNTLSSGGSGEYWSDTPNPNINSCIFSLGIDKMVSGNYVANIHGAGSMYNGYSIRCVEDNYVPVSSISINKTNLSLKIGSNEQLTAIILPENASNKSVVWLSSNDAVATVNGNTGSVYAKAPGDATITAKVDNELATCDVHVYGTPQTGIHLNKTQIRLKVGETFKLEASVTPPDATYDKMTWTSLNPSIATVDQNGNVKAIKEGSTSINVATNVMSTGCTVIVDKTGGDGGSTGGNTGSITGRNFTSAQIYYYGNLSSNTSYFRISLFNRTDNDNLTIEGFCKKAYSFNDFIIDPGTYTFSSTYGTPMSFIEGEYFGVPGAGGRYMGSYYYKYNSDCVLFNGGTVTVSKSGNQYTISTNLSGYSSSSSSTYKNLKFTFSGVPEKINYLNQ